jgi:hypothetical protein
MSVIQSLKNFEIIINRGSMPAYILGGVAQKGAIGRYNQYKFVVNSDDHMPPHIHISLNNKQIAKYDLLTGNCIQSGSENLNKLFASWYSKESNRDMAVKEWERFHGPIG